MEKDTFKIKGKKVNVEECFKLFAPKIKKCSNPNCGVMHTEFTSFCAIHKRHDTSEEAIAFWDIYEKFNEKEKGNSCYFVLAMKLYEKCFRKSANEDEEIQIQKMVADAEVRKAHLEEMVKRNSDLIRQNNEKERILREEKEIVRRQIHRISFLEKKNEDARNAAIERENKLREDVLLVKAHEEKNKALEAIKSAPSVPKILVNIKDTPRTFVTQNNVPGAAPSSFVSYGNVATTSSVPSNTATTSSVPSNAEARKVPVFQSGIAPKQDPPTVYKRPAEPSEASPEPKKSFAETLENRISKLVESRIKDFEETLNRAIEQTVSKAFGLPK